MKESEPTVNSHEQQEWESKLIEWDPIQYRVWNNLQLTPDSVVYRATTTHGLVKVGNQFYIEGHKGAHQKLRDEYSERDCTASQLESPGAGFTRTQSSRYMNDCKIMVQVRLSDCLENKLPIYQDTGSEVQSIYITSPDSGLIPVQILDEDEKRLTQASIGAKFNEYMKHLAGKYHTSGSLYIGRNDNKKYLTNYIYDAHNNYTKLYIETPDVTGLSLITMSDREEVNIGAGSIPKDLQALLLLQICAYFPEIKNFDSPYFPGFSSLEEVVSYVNSETSKVQLC